MKRFAKAKRHSHKTLDGEPLEESNNRHRWPAKNAVISQPLLILVQIEYTLRTTNYNIYYLIES